MKKKILIKSICIRCSKNISILIYQKVTLYILTWHLTLYLTSHLIFSIQHIKIILTQNTFQSK